MKGSPCLYRFVKMRSSSAMPPKLVRSAGAAGAEAGPAAAAEAEAEKDAEVEVEVDESEDAAPVVDAALLLFLICFQKRGMQIGIGQVRARVVEIILCVLVRVKEK